MARFITMGYSLIVAAIGILQFCSLTITSLKIAFSHSITRQFYIPASPYLPCRSLDLTTERFVCEITSEEDEHNLCNGKHCCLSPNSQCLGGSPNKICYPVGDVTTLHYACVCPSTCVHNTDEHVTSWSKWEVNDNLALGFNHSRSLYLIDSGEVLLSEFANRYINHSHRYIVSAYNLPDDVFNASSIYNRISGPERARIDTYFDRVCMWQGRMVVSIPPYLQITLPTVYHVVGIYIAQRCDTGYGLHYAKLINVTKCDLIGYP